MKRNYLTSLVAYLTGWLIANAVWARLINYARRDALRNERDEWRQELGATIAADLAKRLSIVHD